MSSYLLKITLRGTPNLVWRRFVVPSFTTLNRLHDIVQAVMGWEKKHSHAFYLRKQGYFPDGSGTPNGLHENMFSLDDIVFRSGGKLKYIYDPDNDRWTHDLTVESIRHLDATWPYPIYCTEGVRACPPESCGGPAGFTEMLKILDDPKHLEHETVKKQFGSLSFDQFDLDKVNKTFKVNGPITPQSLSLTDAIKNMRRREQKQETDPSLRRLGLVLKQKVAS